MKNTMAVFIFVTFLISCDNTKVERSKFRFSDNESKNIKDSLIEFKNLSLKLFNDDFNNKFSSLLLERDNMINFYHNGKTILQISQQEFYSKKDSVYDLKIFSDLSNKEKIRLFELLSYLNKYYINGIIYNYQDSLSRFPYLGAPFINNKYRDFHKDIIIKSDFSSLKDSKKTTTLRASIIIDNKADLLLLIRDKERYLAGEYGGYDKIPEKWKKPTDEIFHK